MRVFLSGPMGGGKSTVARSLAASVGLPAIDLDARVAERAGRTIQEIFASKGEAGFRRIEREELRLVLAEPGDCVVAVGGGTVTDLESRRLLLDNGVLLTLTAEVEELTRRVANETGRPLLTGRDAVEVLRGLLRDRADAYAECHAVIDTTGLSPDEIAALAHCLAQERRVVVPLGVRSYRAEIGVGVRSRLVERLVEHEAGKPTLIVTDDNVDEPWARPITGHLLEHGLAAERVVVAAGEENKTSTTIEKLWDAALTAGVDRRCFVVSVGGGVVGDMAGFAASTLLRGIRFGQVPTTVLAMVDASVGGKTGFDRPQGKNLVGSFHQPSFVLCDIETLSTLPRRERIAGLAEVVKSAWLAGEEAVAGVEADAEALVAGDPEATARAVEMSLRLKARIVADDEREGDRRRVLNLGHTVGHALEADGGFAELRHGEAVALGLVAAFRVGRTLGHKADAAAERMNELLSTLGLPTNLDDRLRSSVFGFLRADKKRSGSLVRFIVPKDPGSTSIVPVEIASIRAALTPD